MKLSSPVATYAVQLTSPEDDLKREAEATVPEVSASFHNSARLADEADDVSSGSFSRFRIVIIRPSTASLRRSSPRAETTRSRPQYCQSEARVSHTYPSLTMQCNRLVTTDSEWAQYQGDEMCTQSQPSDWSANPLHGQRTLPLADLLQAGSRTPTFHAAEGRPVNTGRPR